MLRKQVIPECDDVSLGNWLQTFRENVMVSSYVLEDCVIIIIIIIIIIVSLSSLCRVAIHIFPRKNHVPRGYTVAAILSLLFMVPLCLVLALALLFFYVSTFRSMCAVPNMAVFCSSLTSWFPGMSLTYFLNDLEMVPVAPIITGITLGFYSPHALYFYCEVFKFLNFKKLKSFKSLKIILLLLLLFILLLLLLLLF